MEKIKISNELIEKAINYSNFRKNLKIILNKYNKNYDKFTITDNDSFLGYISENLVAAYLTLNNIPIKTWSSQINLPPSLKLKVLNNHNSDFDKSEINLLRNYFYDEWDIKHENITVDIKTAATRHNPIPSWTFAIPVIQANKAGKTHVILTYIIYNKDSKIYKDAKPIECYIWGYIPISDITKCSKSNRNEYKGYDYQIENYITHLSNYNQDLISLFDKKQKVSNSIYNK